MLALFDILSTMLAEHPSDLARFQVRSIEVFGSVARGEESDESDVDLLVEFDEKTFQNFMGLKHWLEDLLGRRVDLVTRSALKPAMRDKVLREARRVA